MRNFDLDVKACPDFSTTDLFSESVLQPPRVTPKAQAQKEVLSLGVKEFDSNLLFGGVERGKILNVEVYDRFFEKAVTFFLCALTSTGKKIAVVFNNAFFYSQNVDRIKKCAVLHINEKYQKNVLIWGTDKHPKLILDKAKENEVDFLLLADFWNRSDSPTRVGEFASLMKETDIAAIVISQLQFPSWQNNYRKNVTAMATLLKHCQCSILMRPVLTFERDYVNAVKLKKIRNDLNKSASKRVPSEVLFFQKDSDDIFFKEKLECTFRRGGYDGMSRDLGFDFVLNPTADDFQQATLC